MSQVVMLIASTDTMLEAVEVKECSDLIREIFHHQKVQKSLISCWILLNFLVTHEIMVIVQRHINKMVFGMSSIPT